MFPSCICIFIFGHVCVIHIVVFISKCMHIGHVHVNTRMHTHMLCMYVYIYIYTYIHSICVNMQMSYMHSFGYIYIFGCITNQCRYRYIYISICVHTYMHTCNYAYILPYTHICSRDKVHIFATIGNNYSTTTEFELWIKTQSNLMEMENKLGQVNRTQFIIPNLLFSNRGITT